MSGFHQELHVQPRTLEIERIYQENKADIKADIESLELSFRDLAAKYNVNDRNVRRWCERCGIDPAWRSKERRVRKLDAPKCYTKKSQRIKEDRPQAHKLAGLW